VAEWSNVPDSKSGVGATLPWVRIPPSPPEQDLLTRSVGLPGAQSPAPRGAFCFWLLTDPMVTRPRNPSQTPFRLRTSLGWEYRITNIVSIQVPCVLKDAAERYKAYNEAIEKNQIRI